MKHIPGWLIWMLALCVWMALTVNICFGQITPDFLCQMSGTNNGMVVDVNVAGLQTYNTSVGAGTWTIGNGNSVLLSMWVSNSAAFAFHTPVSINGFTYPGGNQGWVSDYSNATNFMQYRFTGSGTNRVSAGCFYKFHGLGTSFASFNDGYLGGQGDFASVSISDDGNPTPHFYIGIETSGNQFNKNFEIQNDVWYWVTWLYLQNGNAQLSLYEVATWTLVGNTNGILSNAGCDRAFIGRSDAHQLFPAVKAYKTGLVISYGTGTFPLGPGGGGIPTFKNTGIKYSGLTFK